MFASVAGLTACGGGSGDSGDSSSNKKTEEFSATLPTITGP